MEKKKVALFRYECIEPLINAGVGECGRLLEEIIKESRKSPDGKSIKLSRTTILRWLGVYRNKGLKGLEPKVRKDLGNTKALAGEIQQALIRLKEERPRLTVEALIYQARQKGIVGPGQHLPRSTVYRLLRRHGLMDKKPAPAVDRRRFEAEAPMELWQADVMHGVRIGSKKVYLIAIIDDYSRIIPWAEFRPSEKTSDFIAVLRQALQRRGLPRKIYVDNGSTFRSIQLAYGLASMGVNLIHSTPYQPEGKGKCERWFRTVRMNFLPQLTLEDLSSMDTLNKVFLSWIDSYYHQRIHSSTGQAPIERFIQGAKAIRRVPDNFDDHFRHRVSRRVGKDRAVSLMGKAFEAPPGCIGKQLELRFHLDRPQEIEAFEQGKSIGQLKLIYPHSNAKVKRDKEGDLDLETTARKPVSSGKVPFNTK